MGKHWKRHRIILERVSAEGRKSAVDGAGNDRARLIDVVIQLLPFIGYPHTLNGLWAIDEVTAS